MCDKESKDLARKEKKMTPSPSKKMTRRQMTLENKENEDRSCRKSIIFTETNGDGVIKDKKENNFDHPIYKEISRKNGLINRSDLSTLKRMCKEEGIDSSGKRNLIQQRLKSYFRAKMLREAGLISKSAKGFDYFVVVDFEATCEERNLPDYPHEIIEFPGVLVDGKTGKIMDHWREYCKPVINTQLSEFCKTLTGIEQSTVDSANTFPQVLENFNVWLEEKGLGSTYTFALVTGM